MKKRMIALATVFLLTVTCLIGCGSKGLDENEFALQEQWIACLEFSEEIYETMEWVFSYAEEFSDDNNWDSMMKARAACSSAMFLLNHLETPAALVTQEQYSALMEDGIEADVVYQEYQCLDANCGYGVDSLRRLECFLRDDIYLAPSADRLTDWLEINRENIRLQCEYLCLTTNYLLLQLGDDTLWKKLPERFPVIAAAQGPWSQDPEALQMACGGTLNTMEALFAEENTFLGTSEYTLKIVKEAVETGNLNRLKTMIHRMDDVPAYFPLPSWIPVEATWHYLIPGADSDSPGFVQAGQVIDQVPSACYISCGVIPREDVMAYGEYLKQWRIEVYSTWNDSNDIWQLLAHSGNSTMMIQWKESETVIYLTEPVGCLIPELYLYAMTME